ncbi:MAG: hypothetical protein H6576_01910 [Lewinellaceae bacterium]|nr:hypothetical protein [Saprospiraceae bacterium]MCB9342435.1 hypothetical protein [Lewinellaceae bacterium]
MNDLLKNPIIVFFAGLLALWLVFKLLNIVLGMFWLFVLAFVVLFIVNDRFRNLIKSFFNSIFNR